MLNQGFIRILYFQSRLLGNLSNVSRRKTKGSFPWILYKEANAGGTKVTQGEMEVISDW